MEISSLAKQREYSGEPGVYLLASSSPVRSTICESRRRRRRRIVISGAFVLFGPRARRCERADSIFKIYEKNKMSD